MIHDVPDATVSQDTNPRQWLRHPGEVFDRRGIPVYPGDLIRSFYVTGARRKRHYQYHTAVYCDGAMFLVPSCNLDPSHTRGAGGCLLSQYIMRDADVISGSGPGNYIDYEDRPRRAEEMT